MMLIWPHFMFLMAVIPVLAAMYLWSQRRRRKSALRFSSLMLIYPALVRPPRLRRYTPPGLFLLSLASLVVALARPTAMMKSQTNQTTIILDLDVSGSMRFGDIEPSRLAAAEAAASTFIKLQKAGNPIGIVVFSSDAQLIVPPTTDRDPLYFALQSLTTGDRTAIGSSILTSVDAISYAQKERQAKQIASGAVPVTGDFAPDVIVLLTDGVNTIGPTPLQAASEAADRGIRIYAIGFGTRHGSPRLNINTPMAGQPQAPKTGDYGLFNPEIDEETLRQIAEMTGGKYYAPESAHELNQVFSSLPITPVSQYKPQEIGVIFIGLGALLICAALLLSALWRPLP